MILIIRCIAFIAILHILYSLLFPYIKTLSSKRKKKTKDFLNETKKNKRKDTLNYYKNIIVKSLSNDYILSDIKKQEYLNILKRLDSKISPYELRLRQISFVVLAFLISYLMFQINPILGYIALMFVIVGWYLPIDDLEKRVEKKNNNILQDFPAFYSMVYYQYSKSVNIYFTDVIRDFLPNANKDMAEELGVILDNIEYGEEYALKEFKRRVKLKQIFKFCDIMETRLRGYDNTSQMTYFKNEISQMRVVALEEELNKREAKNKSIQLILLIILGIYISIYFYYQFLSAIKLFE